MLQHRPGFIGFRQGLLTGLLAFSLVISGLAVSGCSGGGLGFNPSGKVATVDGIDIPRSDYEKAYKDVAKGLNIHLESIADPSQKQMITDTLKQMTVQKLILDTLVKEEAQKMGIVIADADIQKYKDDNINKNPQAKAQLKQFLESNNMSEKDFDNTLREALLVEKFVEQKAGDKIKVGDAEVNSYYKSHPELFKLPEQIHASHILVKFIEPQIRRDLKASNPKMTDAELAAQMETKKAELKVRADKIYADVKAHPDQFAQIAKTQSDDTASAVQGGDLNYVIERSMDPVFWAALKQTPSGSVHDGVVQTQFGYHVIKVEDTKPAKNQTFDEAKPMITRFIEQEKKQQVMSTWVNQKRAEAKISYDPEFQPKQQEMPQGAPPPAAGMAPAPAQGPAQSPVKTN